MTRRKPADQVDGDVPEPDARYALVGEANPADALPAFKQRIVAKADSTELQHVPPYVPKTTTPLSHEYLGCGDVGLRTRPLKFPSAD